MPLTPSPQRLPIYNHHKPTGFWVMFCLCVLWPLWYFWEHDWDVIHLTLHNMNIVVLKLWHNYDKILVLARMKHVLPIAGAASYWVTNINKVKFITLTSADIFLFQNNANYLWLKAHSRIKSLNNAFKHGCKLPITFLRDQMNWIFREPTEQFYQWDLLS